MQLVFLGAPGVGKGTQADKVAAQYGVMKISTGDLLREAVRNQTKLGLEAKGYMDQGRLVPDSVVIGLVRDKLADPRYRKGFILDGFPRTVAQAEALDETLDDVAPLIVVDIEVPDETLVERLSARRICASCGALAVPGAAVCHKCGGALVQRTDDTADVVRERLRVYGRETQPLVDFYSRRPTFRAVDGDQPPDGVARDIAAAIAAVQGAQR